MMGDPAGSGFQGPSVLIPEELPFLAGADISPTASKARRKGIIRLSDFMQESPQRFTDDHSRATVGAGGN